MRFAVDRDYHIHSYLFLCSHVAEALPLPTDPDVEFVFGCGTDMDKFLTVGLTPEHFNRFGFIIIPTTHLHMKGFTIDAAVTLEERAEGCWI